MTITVQSEVLATSGLICFWSFQEPSGEDRLSAGAHAYPLREMNGPIARVDGGVFGPYAARLDFGQWLRIPRDECSGLNMHGPQSQVSVAAWLRWGRSAYNGCEAVAGMWDESRLKRQYCLFLNLRIWDSAEQVCGHVSSVGGPTPGYKYCMDSAIGSTPVTRDEWHFVAFTYDGAYAKAYLDGRLDERETYNPYRYEGCLFDGGSDGADFTVGAVDRSGEPGNFFTGTLGGLAVFDRALGAEEIAALAAKTLPARA
ncbi:LamG domain-containing protein [Paenibacillus ginsengarvi]|uniref:LamG domain-containing protein n=1 Tax=Paenibacillus ginsengarvi TaxID=400777 RepID=A0A3B0CHW2_9BACL|nr:LamG domain-containing protein [Paenibacillus ginsengarvi]RKN84973.1 LamG domain-containing protein [Paenibacillus ginsengarvi]